MTVVLLPNALVLWPLPRIRQLPILDKSEGASVLLGPPTQAIARIQDPHNLTLLDQILQHPTTASLRPVQGISATERHNAKIFAFRPLPAKSQQASQRQ
jgi:hypothetical protein